MKTITVTRITLTPVQTGFIPCSVFYSLDSNPTNFILIDSKVVVPPSGVLTMPLVINGIADTEGGVTIKAIANCGGASFSQHLTSPVTTTTTTAGTTTTTTAGTTTTTTSGTTTTTTAGTTTTTTSGTTTTTTGGTTSSTTSGTTTTTTAGTTTTTTTVLAMYGLVINKNVAADNVTVVLNDGTPHNYNCPSGTPNCEFPGVVNGTFPYSLTVDIVPSGRPNAPIDVSNDATGIVSCGACTHVEATGVNGFDGNIYVEIGI